MDKENNQKNKLSKKNDVKIEKIEVCYTCGVEFNINEDDESHYHYGKYPMCNYCSEFYGFYKNEL